MTWAENRDSFTPAAAKEKGKEGGDGDQHTVIRRLRERGDGHFIERLDKGDILCVGGVYDKVQNVVEHLGLPHTFIEREAFAKETAKLHPNSVMVFNCHDHQTARLTEDDIAKIQKFVKSGGYVFTSDWELRNVIIRAFPGYVKVGATTGEHEFKITPGAGAQNFPLLRDVFPANPFEREQFRWKIDNMSYGVVPISREKVAVLVASPELGRNYGSDAVAVYFRYGHGAVLHVLSHFEKQTDPKGDGFALQQLFLNFVVEKQKWRANRKKKK